MEKLVFYPDHRTVKYLSWCGWFSFFLAFGLLCFSFIDLSLSKINELVGVAKISFFLGILNMYLLFYYNLYVAISEKEIYLTRKIFGLTLQKKIKFIDIKKVYVRTIFPKLKIIHANGSSSLHGDLSINNSNLPKVEFKEHAPIKLARAFLSFKYEIDKKVGLKNDEPYSPYKYPLK